MKQWIAILLIVLLAVAAKVYFSWKPDAVNIAREMKHSDNGEITHQGKKYTTDWGSTEKVEGFLRIKERHYDENMPIVTYDLVITSGEYSDPEVVEIESTGGGNFYWRSEIQPKGELVSYHTIPASAEVQKKLDETAEGSTISLTGRISQNSHIQGDDGSFNKLMHNNHKFILIEDVLIK